MSDWNQSAALTVLPTWSHAASVANRRSYLDQQVFVQQLNVESLLCCSNREEDVYSYENGIKTLIQMGLNLKGGFVPSEQYVQSILQKSTT